MGVLRILRRSLMLQCAATAGFGAYSLYTPDRQLLGERRRGCTIINKPTTKERLSARVASASGKLSNVLTSEERECVSAVLSLLAFDDAALTASKFDDQCRVECPISVLSSRTELQDYLALGAAVSHAVTANGTGVKPRVTGITRGLKGELHIDFETTVPFRGVDYAPTFKSSCRCVLTSSRSADEQYVKLMTGTSAPKVASAEDTKMLWVQHRWGGTGSILGSPSFDGSSWATRAADALRRGNGAIISTVAAAPRVWEEFNAPPIKIQKKADGVE